MLILVRRSIGISPQQIWGLKIRLLKSISLLRQLRQRLCPILVTRWAQLKCSMPQVFHIRTNQEQRHYLKLIMPCSLRHVHLPKLLQQEVTHRKRKREEFQTVLQLTRTVRGISLEVRVLILTASTLQSVNSIAQHCVNSNWHLLSIQTQFQLNHNSYTARTVWNSRCLRVTSRIMDSQTFPRKQISLTSPRWMGDQTFTPLVSHRTQPVHINTPS